MNNPEYCQNIYEAAKALVEFYTPERVGDNYHRFLVELDWKVADLKRALEGKEQDTTQNLINQVRHLHD